MLTVPIEEMVSAEVLQVIRNALGVSLDELDECTTDEEYFAALETMPSSRWSCLGGGPSSNRSRVSCDPRAEASGVGGLEIVALG
jgi:hypothetical protein